MYKVKRKMRVILPEGEDKLLLLSCCAPCAGESMEALKNSGINFTLYFYNPNIFPQEEYLKRKEEQKSFAQKLSIPFVEGEYDFEKWQKATVGLEKEPERGKRCSECFKLRLTQAARYAQENGFTLFSSVFGISRWKDMDQVNRCGEEVTGNFPSLTYWTYNWRQDGGGQRMYELARQENFYQQTYCGCPYSIHS